MKKVFLLTATAMFLLLTSEVNQLFAQAEFATVRLVTSWSKGSTLLVSIGNSAIEEIELKQKYSANTGKDDYELDNIIINEKFSNLYANGFRLVSTSSSDFPREYSNQMGREVIYLLVKE